MSVLHDFANSNALLCAIVAGAAGGAVFLAAAAWRAFTRANKGRTERSGSRSGRAGVHRTRASERAQRFVQAQTAAGDPPDWAEDDDSARSADHGAAYAAAGESKTILIADDDPVIVAALSRRLQRLGFHVLRLPDAVHALSGTMQIKPDLIILDVNMPAGNGLAVAEMIVSNPQYAHTPLVVHSALADEGARERCRQLGARYVEKSAHSWADIRAVVEELLGPGSGAVETAESAAQVVPPSSVRTFADVARLAHEVAAQPVEPAPPHVEPVCGHARVLCIDSPQGELDAIENRLAALGVTVHRVHDLEEGFLACSTQKPHAVIIETAAASKQVLAVLKRFVSHPLTRDFPLLFINHRNAIPAAKLPTAANFKALHAPLVWKEFLDGLEHIVPIAGRQNDDPLARAAEHGLAAAAALPPAAVPGAAVLRILCIDDDPLVVHSIAARLKPYGIEFKGAQNGTAGYLQAISDQPDVVFLDLQMPNGDGHYVLAKLKEHPRTKHIPVVMLTMETNRGVRRQMLSLGASGFLVKPVRWHELFEELGRHVQLPQQAIKDYELHAVLPVPV
jgi:CheY-like chemotaxis protein